jgi:hypothetical protein
MHNREFDLNCRQVLKVRLASAQPQFMCKRFDLPLKKVVDSFDIKLLFCYNHRSTIKYNCQDLDLHMWLAKKMLVCKRICTLAGLARNTIYDLIATILG